MLVFASPACGRTAAAPPLAPGEGIVSKHVDGDTLHVDIGGRDETVRFIGIDTPETHGRGGLRECFGKEASDRTAKLLPLGTRVRLVRDVEARDRYRRLLAYVYRGADDLFINLELARQGYAAVLTYAPNVAHTAEFVAAAAEARIRNRGLWDRCGDADVPIT